MRQAPIHILVQVAAFALVLARIAASGLFRSYRWFTAFIAFELFRAAAALTMRHGTDTYALFYFRTTPVVWFLQTMVVLEVFRVALRSHPGVATLGRRVVLAGLLLSAAVAASTIGIGGGAENSPFEKLENYILVERVINTTLLLFVLLLGAFLAHFPVPLTRNALLHTSIFGFYFFLKTALWTARTFIGIEFTRYMNLAISTFMIGALIAWTILLSRSGEEARIQTRHPSDPLDERRLLEQLERLNRTLANTARERSLR